MPNLATHIALAQQAAGRLQHPTIEANVGHFLLGSTTPDVRAISRGSREDYHFAPLDERVPVYQQPFMLLQEVVVSGAAEVEEALAELDALTLTGTLDYQACDDELCFEPVSVPLSFTLDLDLLDRQPANR